jgi:hypothetical protein
MTEKQWRASTDPQAMLDRARLSGLASQRKRLLFLAACLRRLWPVLLYQGSREAAEVLERVADRVATDEERAAAAQAAGSAADVARADADNVATPDSASAHVIYVASLAACVVRDAFRSDDPCSLLWAVAAVGRSYCIADGPLSAEAALLRDLFGPLPFRLLTPLAPAWLRWNEGTVGRLAEGVYGDRRLPEGTLDPTPLTVLADALEDAGCDQADLLSHLRGPGPHVRGCWAVDLVLGKE